MQLKRLCKDCPSIEWCTHAFGQFWREKSNGSRGCNRPLPEDPSPFYLATGRTRLREPKNESKPQTVVQSQFFAQLTDEDY